MEELVNKIEKHFNNNWSFCPLVFDGTEYTPDPNTSWLFLEVVPTISENCSVDTVGTTHLKYTGYLGLTAYGKNKVQALKIITELQSFLQNTTPDGITFRGFTNLANADYNGQYFYKTSWKFEYTK
jgi:hypothetical protein